MYYIAVQPCLPGLHGHAAMNNLAHPTILSSSNSSIWLVQPPFHIGSEVGLHTDVYCLLGIPIRTSAFHLCVNPASATETAVMHCVRGASGLAYTSVTEHHG